MDVFNTDKIENVKKKIVKKSVQRARASPKKKEKKDVKSNEVLYDDDAGGFVLD